MSKSFNFPKFDKQKFDEPSFDEPSFDESSKESNPNIFVNNNRNNKQLTQQELYERAMQEKGISQEDGPQNISPTGENPFNSPDYNNIGSTDTPIQYGGGMAEILLSDNDVPKKLKKKYWFVFNKDNVLTFLDKKRKQDKLRAFDTAIIDTMNSMDSYDDYTFDKELEYGLIRNAFDIKMDRAVGTTSNNKNERIILQTQFSESKQVNEQSGSGSVKEGFFKRLLGRR